jgi:glutathione peroxidase
MSTLYDITVRTNALLNRSLSEYKGKVLLIVNTASKCAFTPQYEGLEALYRKYRERGFEVLAFPCNQFMGQEPGTNDEIKQFCAVNFNITFPVFDKLDVKGPTMHPLYKLLTAARRGFLGSRSIKWNFTKFLVDRQGRVVKRFSPRTRPENLEGDIIKSLDEK